jgi:ubiquinone/menaquinone biosynthesis C-methylase UbiE
MYKPYVARFNERGFDANQSSFEKAKNWVEISFVKAKAESLRLEELRFFVYCMKYPG